MEVYLKYPKLVNLNSLHLKISSEVTLKNEKLFNVIRPNEDL